MVRKAFLLLPPPPLPFPPLPPLPQPPPSLAPSSPVGEGMLNVSEEGWVGRWRGPTSSSRSARTPVFYYVRDVSSPPFPSPPFPLPHPSALVFSRVLPLLGHRLVGVAAAGLSPHSSPLPRPPPHQLPSAPPARPRAAEAGRKGSCARRTCAARRPTGAPLARSHSHALTGASTSTDGGGGGPGEIPGPTRRASGPRVPPGPAGDQPSARRERRLGPTDRIKGLGPLDGGVADTRGMSVMTWEGRRRPSCASSSSSIATTLIATTTVAEG